MIKTEGCPDPVRFDSVRDRFFPAICTFRLLTHEQETFELGRKRNYLGRKKALFTKNGASEARFTHLINMAITPFLTEAEFESLAEVGTGFLHADIPLDHAKHLRDLGLTYNLLGSVRITTAGRIMLMAKPDC